MGCSANEFGSIGLCKFTAAYEVYCEAKGISTGETDNSYNDYLDLKNKLEPLLERNRAKIEQAKKASKKGLANGNGSGASSKN